MELLGMHGNSNSGAGWVQKGDGTNDYLLAELKSTDAKSIRILFEDMWKLQAQAAVEHKVPIFLIQDLTNNEIYVMMLPSDIHTVAKYLKTGETKEITHIGIDYGEEESQTVTTTIVAGSADARNEFYETRAKQRKGKGDLF